MTNNFLLVFAILGWGLTIYFGFFRYRQYVWSRKKVQYDLFTRINQRSDRLYLSLSVLLVLPRKGDKGKAKFAALKHKYLEGIFEKIVLIRGAKLPEELALFWTKGIQTELSVLSDQDENFTASLRQQSEKFGWETAALELFLTAPQTRPNQDASERILEQLLA